MSPKPPATHTRDRKAIPRVSLIILCSGLFLATLPLFGRMAAWVLGVFLMSLGARGWIEYTGARLPSASLKFGLVAAGIIGVLASYDTIVGSEAGMCVLMVLVGTKMLETASPRDFQISALLGYFLCLSDLFFAQEMALCFYVGVVALIITAALVHFHSGP